MTGMLICDAPEHGGPEVLKWLRAPVPVPGPDEVLIEVGASGVNRLDAMQRQGIYPLPPDANPVLGIEVGGVVRAVGANVDHPRPGQRVAALLSGGGYAEMAVAHHRHVVVVPDDWSDIEAAAVIETFCTAHETLFELSQLRAGERVLIHAGGSAVGSVALRMAQAVGAQIATTAGHPDKIARLNSWGLAHVINYRDQDLVAVLREAWPEGLDVIEDFIGASRFADHLSLLRWRGRMALVGLLAPGEARMDVAGALTRMIQIRGFTLRPHSIEEKAAVVDRFRQRWLPELVAGRIAPEIHAVLPFGDAREAHAMLEAGANFGKIILSHGA